MSLRSPDGLPGLIPAIRKDQQVPILETHVLATLRATVTDEQFEQLHLRLKAGAAKYGTAWSEVDLATDVLEELMDTLNYLAMLEVRLMWAGSEPVTPLVFWLRDRIKDVSRLVDSLNFMLPAFEGPSSKDWVIQQGLDPARQQAKFQEVLHHGDDAVGVQEEGL